MILQGQVFSKTLEMSTPLSILAPEQTSQRQSPYKVVYLLHGMMGNSGDMLYYTRLPQYAQQYPCVFVLPSGARSLYTDMAVGQRYFSYIAKELPEICKNLFQISARPEDTFIVGNSAGGYGALCCALRFPHQYGACCANAPGPLFLREFLAQLREGTAAPALLHSLGPQFVEDCKAAFGSEYPWRAEIDPLALAQSLEQPAAAPRILLQCGTEDTLVESVRRFAAEMETLPLPFQYEESPGGHDWPFFDRALATALEFCLRPPVARPTTGEG